MPGFKQKNVIKSYKLRLQDKLKTVTEETEASISFLNNCLLKFNNRVQQILEIKDEKCLSLYRKLISDLENYSEKLFILQASLEEDSDEEDSQDEESESRPPTDQSNSASCLSSHVHGASGATAKSDLEEYCDIACALPDVKPDSEFYGKNASQHANNSKSESYPYTETVSCQYELKSELNDDCEDDFDLKENIKTKLQEDSFEGAGSTTEDDFYSLHSDSIAQNITTVSLNSHSHKYHDGFDYQYESSQSFSQRSCYRSLSSNIDEQLALPSEAAKSLEISKIQPTTVRNDGSLESTCIIRLLDFEIPSTFSATLAYIVDPGNFWIQIKNSYNSKLRFPKSEHCHLSSPSSIKEGDYCLAPFMSSPFFYRAVSLSNAKSEREKIKIHFIDYGSTEEISLCDLRLLPSAAYDIPAQALHCYLHGVAPINGIWSAECIEKFRDFQDYHSIEAVLKAKENLYAVQLIANSFEDFNEDFSVNVALYLCFEGLAISENEFNFISIGHNHESEMQPPTSIPTTSGIKSIEVSDITAVSNDSGVSVTSSFKENFNTKDDSDKISRANYHGNSTIPVVTSSIDSYDKKFGFNYDYQVQDLISFENYSISDFHNSDEITKFPSGSSKPTCLSCNSSSFCLHLKVPPPDLVFVEKNMLIVMLSHIVTPHEFYVNMAMENIVNLDELREQMTTTYESEKEAFPPITMNDIQENMFCAGYYVDGYWYRVKIIKTHLMNEPKDLVAVQYIDYGNTAIIKCSCLQPLTPQFSQHPTFAIKCSLAGIKPVKDNSISNDFSSVWDEDAISIFKQITNFDQCLTAQICTELGNKNNDALPVLLWDTEESNDRLLNFALADLGMAKIDENFSSAMHLYNEIMNPSSNISNPSNVIDVLNAWDPMSEEYNDIENNYGVDDEDIQVATTGYQARDEEYTCKYYSLRGYCPRGDSCPYEHLSLLENGDTRDQEAVYCLDSLPVLPNSTLNTIINVSTIINPSHFYIVLPYGCKTVNEINNLVNRGCSESDILNSEAKVLFHAINKHYSNAPFQENTALALACGTIVVSRRFWDKQWHRGRVVDVSDVNGPAKIFFVDSGDSEWVPRKFIRTILPQFLYTPFQAVQCSLNGVAPKDAYWDIKAVHLFKKAVEGESLLAENIHKFGQVIHLSLRKTTEHNHQYISEILVSAGLAKFCVDVPAQGKEPLFVPG